MKSQRWDHFAHTITFCMTMQQLYICPEIDHPTHVALICIAKLVAFLGLYYIDPLIYFLGNGNLNHYSNI